jgi:hypothetical protein
MLLLRIAKGPEFIALDLGGFHVADCGIMEHRTGSAGIDQQLLDGVERHILDTRSRTHRGIFAEHMENVESGREGQLVHVLIVT